MYLLFLRIVFGPKSNNATATFLNKHEGTVVAVLQCLAGSFQKNISRCIACLRKRHVRSAVWKITVAMLQATPKVPVGVTKHSFLKRFLNDFHPMN